MLTNLLQIMIHETNYLCYICFLLLSDALRLSPEFTVLELTAVSLIIYVRLSQFIRCYYSMNSYNIKHLQFFKEHIETIKISLNLFFYFLNTYQQAKIFLQNYCKAVVLNLTNEVTF